MKPTLHDRKGIVPVAMYGLYVLAITAICVAYSGWYGMIGCCIALTIILSAHVIGGLSQ